MILYWIEHHRTQIAEMREILRDKQCDVAACEAERGPAPRRDRGRLPWPFHLIEKLMPVDLDRSI